MWNEVAAYRNPQSASTSWCPLHCIDWCLCVCVDVAWKLTYKMQHAWTCFVSMFSSWTCFSRYTTNYNMQRTMCLCVLCCRRSWKNRLRNVDYSFWNEWNHRRESKVRGLLYMCNVNANLPSTIDHRPSPIVHWSVNKRSQWPTQLLRRNLNVNADRTPFEHTLDSHALEVALQRNYANWDCVLQLTNVKFTRDPTTVCCEYIPKSSN